MNNNTKQKLELFAKFNNWQMSHPLDMKRFYEFIIKAYKNGDTEISKDEFLEMVNPIYKMNEEELDRWIIKFECGVELLKAYNKNG